jgi:negative regulator of replication initiation
LEILAARDEEAISRSDLALMKANLARLTSEREKEMEEVIAKQKKHGEAALHSAVSMSNLNHKAETAELNAITNQQVKEIQSLNQTIANLKDEVAAQRKLTESVANAGRQAPITLQTNGK